ncbi:MAG: Peptidoglycan endopeptidase LytF precursor [Pelotomaculum sp. PtaB.Bin104]|nr:MAG: Peptidoglycan endopeptidase LytF precursor [Pelotomaculum sp. PtaB.Bin104]
MLKNSKSILFTLVLTLMLAIIIPATGAYAEQTMLQQGAIGNEVVQLQGQLQKLGYYSGPIDGDFGPATHSAVLSFQKDRGLVCDGIAGQATLQALQKPNMANSTAINKTTGAQAGSPMSANEVLQLQTRLKALGYYQGSLDGDFGPLTSRAVVDFQSNNGLVADGVVGPATLGALQGAAPATVSRGSSLNRKGETAVSLARKYLGTRYVWSGSSPGGFDCSGFTTYVYKQLGVSLPRTASEQFNTGVRVKKPAAGDLVFFTTYQRGASHVGICIGNNQFIHASSGAGKVVITSLSDGYYSSRYLGARRIFN